MSREISINISIDLHGLIKLFYLLKNSPCTIGSSAFSFMESSAFDSIESSLLDLLMSELKNSILNLISDLSSPDGKTSNSLGTVSEILSKKMWEMIQHCIRLEEEVKASRLLKLLADMGDARAQFEIGIVYNDAKDFKSASQYYHLACEKNYGKAFSNLGWYYNMGIFVNQDNAKALELYSRGFKLGDVNSIYNLAMCYDKGIGVPRDIQYASDLYWQGTLMGHKMSLNKLAICYKQGIGVRQDYDMAAWLYTSAICSDLKYDYNSDSNSDYLINNIIMLYNIYDQQMASVIHNLYKLKYIEYSSIMYRNIINSRAKIHLPYGPTVLVEMLKEEDRQFDIVFLLCRTKIKPYLPNDIIGHILSFCHVTIYTKAKLMFD